MSFRVEHTKYRFILIPPDGRRLNITDVILEAKYEDMEDELSARLILTVKNILVGDKYLNQLCYLAHRMIVEATTGGSWQEVWRGSIYRYGFTTEEGSSFTAICYDALFPLQQSKDQVQISSSETVAETISKLARKWGIPIGRIDGPHRALEFKIYKGDKIGKIFSERIKEAKKRGSPRFFVRDEKGQLNIVREGSNTIVYKLDRYYAEKSEDEHNIENIITRVKVYGTSKENTPSQIVYEQDGRINFGVIQDVVFGVEGRKEAQEKAAEILQENGQPNITRSIYGPDIPFLRKGDVIEVEVGTLLGKFMVSSVSRDIGTLQMTVQLKVAK
ncbi:XkdQ/YqbQ family protein [Bacillus sp. FJAT-45350]|uniref:XkdQ/YqbQ family protein n=1 Tax=Bacillus sp. FJAT-45350 TaxID=2011014 RepID=UPI000BB6F096|nr:hypothetical protein [Bacillus sp. FJAT-45350]